MNKDSDFFPPAKSAPKPKTDSKDIWGAEEVGDGAEYEDIHDPRPSPE